MKSTRYHPSHHTSPGCSYLFILSYLIPGNHPNICDLEFSSEFPPRRSKGFEHIRKASKRIFFGFRKKNQSNSRLAQPVASGAKKTQKKTTHCFCSISRGKSHHLGVYICQFLRNEGTNSKDSKFIT